MPERRDRNDVIAAELERVADALRDDEAAVYGYDVGSEPEPSESGGISYPGGWFEFRFEHEPSDGESRGDGGSPDAQGSQE